MTTSALELQFGSVSFFNNIQIAELKEGILFDIPHNQEILELARKQFRNQPYGYISNRVNSYSVNPMIHLESANVSNLIAIAVVSKNPLVKQNCIIEKQFFRNSSSFEVFETLEEAINWMKHQLI
tara:strand:+ start:1408 stop:1782 length:375 start_codon:yes stop_codon:yes gene_type:complete